MHAFSLIIAGDKVFCESIYLASTFSQPKITAARGQERYIYSERARKTTEERKGKKKPLNTV